MPVTVFQTFSYLLILLRFEPMACRWIETKKNRKYHKLVHTFSIIPLSERFVKIGLSVDADYGKEIETPRSNRSLKLSIVFHEYYAKRALKRSGTLHLKPHLKYVSTYPPPHPNPDHFIVAIFRGPIKYFSSYCWQTECILVWFFAGEH